MLYASRRSIALELISIPGCGDCRSLPLNKIVQGLNYIRMFLDQIFNSVLVILVLLGVVLIYSLLLSDVEEKVQSSVDLALRHAHLQRTWHSR